MNLKIVQEKLSSVKNIEKKKRLKNVNRTSETYNIRTVIYIYLIGVTGEERENGVENSVKK